jgi:hypothetical protein
MPNLSPRYPYEQVPTTTQTGLTSRTGQWQFCFLIQTGLLRVLDLWCVITANIGFPLHVALISSAESKSRTACLTVKLIFRGAVANERPCGLIFDPPEISKTSGLRPRSRRLTESRREGTCHVTNSPKDTDLLNVGKKKPVQRMQQASIDS